MATYTYGNDLISMTKISGISEIRGYYHYDGLGTTRQLTDSAGVVTVAYTYDAFGNKIAGTGTSDNVYGFTGEQQFAEADNLVFLRARYYDSRIGRFISRDPILAPMRTEDNFTWALPSLISQPKLLHLYVYCGNNPINFIDPYGLWSWKDFGKWVREVWKIIIGLPDPEDMGNLAKDCNSIRDNLKDKNKQGKDLGDIGFDPYPGGADPNRLKKVKSK